jgi:hypothetical protein
MGYGLTDMDPRLQDQKIDKMLIRLGPEAKGFLNGGEESRKGGKSKEK